jgi:RimJ/RimL family protein N-acetyltransferase
LEVIRRDSLRNIVLLKFLRTLPGSPIVHQIVRGDDAATLLVVDHRFSPFDQEAYPTASASVVIASDHPGLTRELLTFVPRGQTLIFKLASETDRLVVAEEFPLEKRTAFLSYTSTEILPIKAGARIEVTSTEAPFHMFAAQGHSAEWLGPLIESGRAFISLIAKGGKALSACFAFQIDGAIWEIGGVYTLPEERGRRLAFCVVHTALAELARHGHVPRYQVAEDNVASIGLAESLGMTHFLTLTHYHSGS